MLLFGITYLLLLIIWIQLKPYYGAFMLRLGAGLAAASTGFEITAVAHEAEKGSLSMRHYSMTPDGLGELKVDMEIKVSNYTFNVPLSFALVAGLFPLFRWRIRALLEAALLLMGIHFLYVYSYCLLELYYQLAAANIRTISGSMQLLLEFLWAFTDNMVIRFEPFLVAVYLWLRQAR